MPVMCIHGKQKQTKRTTTFFSFCNADSGILLCTDVAARGKRFVQKIITFSLVTIRIETLRMFLVSF